MGIPDLLLFLIPACPAALAALWMFESIRRSLVSLAPWAAAPAVLLSLFPHLEGTSWSTSGVMAGLRLEVDEMGRAFLFLTALLWLLAGAYARSYHRRDPRRERFFGFFVLTMAGNLGLVVAADVLSFYLFFAWMTFAAYGLVVHRRDEAAFRAGRVYIVLAVAGEVAVLASLFLLGWASAGVPQFGGDLEHAWAQLAGSGHAGWVAGLVLGGFGIKAGLVPLHLWLPLAHPVAPTAASALLSGAMIKAGLLAWIRILPVETSLSAVATGVVVLGALSTLYGVLAGLGQDDAKTVLAYSSVSQMGFMAVGVGLALGTTEGHELALLAVVIYALHHGVAKGALFLSVGVAERVPLEQRGGIVRRKGWILAATALPALALSGAPFTTGALSKGTLKDALYALAPTLNPVLGPVLILAGVGTTVLMARFLVLLAGRIRVREKPAHGVDSPASATPSPWSSAGLIIPWGVLLFIGLSGPWWLARIVPGASELSLPAALSDWPAAAGPLLTGIALAGVVGRWPRVLGGLRRVRIPPGDLLVPVEGMLRGIGALPVARWGGRTGTWVRKIRPSQARLRSWMARMLDRMLDRDLRLARGRIVTHTLLVLVLGLLSLLL
ncbi:MAG: complex I subunit 5 family protein [Gemmatimonadota bacterium]|nr:complex I subunit 5 family protein [Gemmatimonadota bacterium]